MLNILRKISPIVVLVCFMALFALAYYPGYMSFDSALHFSQVESGDWTTFQPVVFLVLWKLCHTFIEGPGGVFLLFMSVYMIGLGLFVRNHNAKWWKQLLVFIVILAAPVNVMLLPHIWKDVALMAFLMLSLGFFVASQRNNRRWLKVAALLSLGLAISFRFEVVLYLWPLLFYFVWVFSSAENAWVRGFVIVSLKSMVFLALVFIVNTLLTHWSGAKKITLWPTIALWDLAAVSIEIDKNLLPEFTTGNDMTVSDLKQAFKPWSNVPLFSKTKSGINTGMDFPYTDAEYKTLLQSWVRLPFTETKAYITHRWRLISELLRINESDNKSKELYYAHKMVKYKASYPANNSVLNGGIEKWLKRNINAFYFKPWFYLLLGLLAMPLLLIRKGGKLSWQSSGLVCVLAACIVLNVLVMLIFAPAAETRYLIVAMNFSLLLWSEVSGVFYN